MEEKKYTVVGKVEIGTDEYRDLIESRMEVEKSKDYYMREGWKKDEEINNLKKQVDVLQQKIQKCEQFMKKNITNFPNDVMSMIFAEIGFGEE